MNKSGFYGSSFELLKYFIIGSLGSILTFGIALPKVYNSLIVWFINNLEIDGKRFKYEGKISELFHILIPVIFFTSLSIIRLYLKINKEDFSSLFIWLYAFSNFLAIISYFKAFQYIISKISVNDLSESKFKAKFSDFLINYFKFVFLMFLGFFTFAITSTYGIISFTKWFTTNVSLSNKEIYFDSELKNLLPSFLISTILIVVTLGLYLPFAINSVLKKIIPKIHFLED